MIINDGNQIRYILTKIERDQKSFYFTISEEGNIYFYTNGKLGDFEELGRFLTNYKDNDVISEISFLKEKECYKIWFEDFTSAEEKKKYQLMEENIKTLFLSKLKLKMKEDLYKFYIENYNFEKWKNSFENKIFEIENNTFYIDDEDFEIFYTVTRGDNYEFLFLEK